MDQILKTLKESWTLIEQEIEMPLDELLIHGDVKTNKNVIAYKQHLWVLPEKVPRETANEIATFLLPESYDDENVPFDDGTPPEVNVYDITSLVNDADRSDILVGSLRNGELVLHSGGGFKLDPKSSLLVKKVANALKIKKVTYQDDLEGNSNISIPRKKITARIPDIAYHGTAIKYLEDILKVGLEPRGHQSNYEQQGIYHDDKIFFATRFGEASHHATHTSSLTKSLPIVLELTIPDKNLVIADYDVDMHGGETTYDAPARKTHTKYGSDKSFALSKEFGVYGYQGKILPQHIRYVYVLFNEEAYDPSIKDYKKFSPKKLRQFLDRYGSFDEIQYYIR
jgi:hypothetical protein